MAEQDAFQMLKEDDFPPRIPLTAKLLINWMGKMRTFSDKSVLKKKFYLPHTISQEASGTYIPLLGGNKPKKQKGRNQRSNTAEGRRAPHSHPGDGDCFMTSALRSREPLWP